MMVSESCSVHQVDEGAVAEFWGPGQVDQTIRQAIQCCWMSLPKEKRTMEELEKQIRRLVDRALRDYREDREAFGLPGKA